MSNNTILCHTTVRIHAVHKIVTTAVSRDAFDSAFDRLYGDDERLEKMKDAALVTYVVPHYDYGDAGTPYFLIDNPIALVKQELGLLAELLTVMGLDHTEAQDVERAVCMLRGADVEIYVYRN